MSPLPFLIVIVPLKLRKNFIDEIHVGHPSVNRFKSRAHAYLFWLGMNGDLEEYCKNCKTCSKFQNNQYKNPLLVHNVPKLPWSEVGSDAFEYRQKYYLVLVGNLSNFIEVRQIRDLTSDEIILNMKSIFSVHCIPIKLYTDGSRYYTSMAFKEFSKNWNIQVACVLGL